MNKSIYLNWQFHVLSLLGMVTIFLLLSDSEDLMTFFISKIIGAAFGYVSFQLIKYWNKNKKIDSLMKIADED